MGGNIFQRGHLTTMKEFLLTLERLLIVSLGKVVKRYLTIGYKYKNLKGSLAIFLKISKTKTKTLRTQIIIPLPPYNINTFNDGEKSALLEKFPIRIIPSPPIPGTNLMNLLHGQILHVCRTRVRNEFLYGKRFPIISENSAPIITKYAPTTPDWAANPIITFYNSFTHPSSRNNLHFAHFLLH